MAEPFALYGVQREEPTKDWNRVFLDINNAYEEIMNVSRQQVMGRTFAEIWPETESLWTEVIDLAAETGDPARREGWNRETGRYLRALSFVPAPGKVAVIFLDSTARQRAEEALREGEQRLRSYRETLRQLATELSLTEEKTRRGIAVELHDRIGYSLARVLEGVRGLQALSADPVLQRRGNELGGDIQRIIRDTRTMTFEISSPLLYEVGLGAAVESLAEHLLEGNGLDFSFSEEGMDVAETMDVRVLLYQMVREVFVNVVKHAGATKVRIVIQKGRDRIQILVEDNGRGFSPEKHMEQAAKRKSFGLFSIRERLRALGGALQIDAGQGKGTSVLLQAPFTAQGREDT